MSDNKTQIEQLRSLKKLVVKPVEVNDTVYVSLNDYLHVVNELGTALGLSGMSAGSLSKISPDVCPECQRQIFVQALQES